MLLDLWLPILLSGLAVHIASAIAWMALPHHRQEWKSFPDEEKVMGAIRDLELPAGQYMFPCGRDMKSESFKARMKTGPWGVLNLWDAAPNMGANMLCTLLFFLGVSFVIAYLGSIGLQPGEDGMTVFRFISTAGILAYCAAGIPNAIWFKRRIRYDLLDGVAFALITGATFTFFWPGAS